jgi:hypothetical protein
MAMSFTTLRRSFPAVACACALSMATIAADQDKQNKKSKPSITVKATPAMGFAPARFVLTAELMGGADDYEDFYCATIEWDWGDDTKSETKQDCEPYEAGKSAIKRRFTVDRTFNLPGEFRVQFRLKQKNKVVGAGGTEVKVRCGVRDGGDFGCR